MKPIHSAGELKAAILELEKRKTVQQLVIKEQSQLAKEALKPKNLVKNTFSKLAETPEIRRTLAMTIVGIGIGYFVKKATHVLSEESLNGMMSNFIDRSTDHLIQRDPESLVSRGIEIARNIIKEKAFGK